MGATERVASRSRWTRWPEAAAWAGLAIALVALVLFARHFDFINDDAFISFRYADNLVRHGELTFNVGERVEGYTNFLWTMLLAAVLALGGDPIGWSKTLGIVFAGGTLVVLFLFSRRWARGGPPRSALWNLVAPILLASNAAFACWAEGGLETALFTLLVTAGILGFVVEQDRPVRLAGSAVLLALASMTRPEGVLVFGLLGIYAVTRRLVAERTVRPTRPMLVWAALFVGAYGPYWLWRYRYYGYLLPNTYYAKAGVALWAPGANYLWSFVRDLYPWVAVPLGALLWRGGARGRAFLAIAATVVVPYALFVTSVGGDFMALHRFFVPVLPLLALLVQEGAAIGWTLFRDSFAPGRALRAGAAVAASGILVLGGVHNVRLANETLEVGSTEGIDSIGWLKMFVAQTMAIGKFLADAYPPGTSLATTAAGVIPYYSRMRTLDLLGLNDAYTAREVPKGGGRPGHTVSAPEDYVLRWRPDLLIWHPRVSSGVPQTSPAEREYWRVRGYGFRFVRVPGMEPPDLSYFEIEPGGPDASRGALDTREARTVPHDPHDP